ncbi:MAG: RHS repeat-associated core domain-containing protein, partial [Candidatus Electrothrix sp. AR3]|nr:RHS repeat-associated core domain-containing protein [Candidatus Electrothrix sp. AR3]
GGATYYLGYDQVGSLRTISDASGNVVKEISYDSFGTILSDSNSAFAVPFGFAGGLHDRDTGLVKFGFRDYDPAIGRWVAKDPIFFAGGDVDLYGYVLGDPVNFVDPDGRAIHIIAGGVIGAAISGWDAYARGASGSEIFEQAFVGGVVGAVSAAIPIVGGTLGGFFGDLASQRISHKYNGPCEDDKYDLGRAFRSGVTGSLGSLFGHNISSGLGKITNKAGNAVFSKPVRDITKELYGSEYKWMLDNAR